MARSGQVTVTTAGTAVRGSDVPCDVLAFAAHPDNTDTAWVGEVSGDVASTNGFPLVAGGAPIIVEASNLNDWWFDTDVNGEKVCWLVLR